ncbi:hypothetical protein [Pseudarthrobacter sp. PS3-L1]|uniref:hypothetical protein n=1 Tax=Pseudarthrobacter sp. PS3-L1 TaxID=3046207 RepID=UPI0024B8EAC6|nr:hypothetical protein [Pseudarthrobacter sp. PS3-L1]MDJ0319793.1 hypothetical protein [Pseudarthrobacter sp. PS3-L1]
MSSGKNLQILINNNRGTRNNVELSRDGGGNPKPSRLQQLATKPLTGFPEAETIRGLARALNVTYSSVISAIAADVGLPMGLPDQSALVLAGAGELPSSSQELLLNMSRELQRLAGATQQVN